MGVVQNVGYDTFPKQGPTLNKRVIVCFNYNTSRTVGGVVVRDDYEAPWEMIIKLDDGRYIMASECQYTFKSENEDTSNG